MIEAAVRRKSARATRSHKKVPCHESDEPMTVCRGRGVGPLSSLGLPWPRFPIASGMGLRNSATKTNAEGPT